jgi:rare lipoprotein A (peptidoglycan hydrolase)
LSLPIFPAPRGKGETLRRKHSRSKRRRNVTILALCGSFVVVPVLALWHRPSSGFVIAQAAAATTAKATAPRFFARSSRAAGNDDVVVDADSPLPVSNNQPTVTAAPSILSSVARGVVKVRRSVVSALTTAGPVASQAPNVVASSSGQTESGVASWLDTIPTGTCANNAAPMGATLYLTTPSGATATCRVVSRGPYVVGRVVDVAKATFARLASPNLGLVDVQVSW